LLPWREGPPNSGETMLAITLANQFHVGIMFVIAHCGSETTADMSDSMAPSIATVKAADKSCRKDVVMELRE